MTNARPLVPLLLLTLLTAEAALLAPTPVRNSRRSRAIRAAEPETEERPLTAEETTEKYGLEAGLFQSLKESLPFGKGGGGDDGGDAKGGMATAGDLLKRYGGAYLLTSTSLAVVSFSFCYWAVSNGVDVGSVLKTVGINVDANAENVGTVGIAYAIHKAASPIRFPPTVALTPLVAKRVFGKTEEEIAAAAEGGEAAAAADGGAADGGGGGDGGDAYWRAYCADLDTPSCCHHAFFVGDLNYRVALAGFDREKTPKPKPGKPPPAAPPRGHDAHHALVRSRVLGAASAAAPPTAREHAALCAEGDELLAEMRAYKVFAGWTTPPPPFAPTFKASVSAPLLCLARF